MNMADVGSIMQGAAGIANFGYNIYADQRNYRNNLRQQEITRDREDNAVQRRVADLKAAGLHPTLAAGHAAQAQPALMSPPNPKSNTLGVMEAALMSQQLKQGSSQIALTNAETDRIRNGILVDTARLDIERERLGLDKNTDSRSGEMHAHNIKMAKVERDLKRAGISNTQVDTLIKALEYRYMVDNNSKMPTRNTFIAEFQSQAEKIIGALLPQSLLDRVYEYLYAPSLYESLPDVVPLQEVPKSGRYKDMPDRVPMPPGWKPPVKYRKW